MTNKLYYTDNFCKRTARSIDCFPAYLRSRDGGAFSAMVWRDGFVNAVLGEYRELAGRRSTNSSGFGIRERSRKRGLDIDRVSRVLRR